jgi:regulator of protease activity HflC (stomatin/prohibitin superfamily)
LKESSLNSEQTSSPPSNAQALPPGIESRVVRGGRFAAVLVTLSLLVIAFLLVFFYSRLFVTIHAGERGVMWSRWTGTQMDSIYLEGTQFVWPWNKMTVYDVRFKMAKKTVSVITKDGLIVSIDMMVRYRPADRMLPNLHETVGTNFVDVVVLPEVVRGLRGVVSKYTMEQMYREKFVDIRNEILVQARIEGGKRYVIIDDVVFNDVRLPESVSQSIQHKMSTEQQSLEMKYVIDMAEAEAKRKQVEAAGIKEQQRLINSTLTDRMLKYKSIEATKELAASPNAKIVMMGNDSGGKDSSRLLLNMGDQPAPAKK